MDGWEGPPADWLDGWLFFGLENQLPFPFFWLLPTILRFWRSQFSALAKSGKIWQPRHRGSYRPVEANHRPLPPLVFPAQNSEVHAMSWMVSPDSVTWPAQLVTGSVAVINQLINAVQFYWSQFIRFIHFTIKCYWFIVVSCSSMLRWLLYYYLAYHDILLQ